MTSNDTKLKLADAAVRVQAGRRPQRRTRWLIWGGAILAVAVVLILAFTAILLSWHITTTDTQWCTFYAGVTRDRTAVSPAFYHELTTLRGAFGCPG